MLFVWTSFSFGKHVTGYWATAEPSFGALLKAFTQSSQRSTAQNDRVLNDLEVLDGL
jgi:hypothetical protein